MFHISCICMQVFLMVFRTFDNFGDRMKILGFLKSLVQNFLFRFLILNFREYCSERMSAACIQIWNESEQFFSLININIIDILSSFPNKFHDFMFYRAIFFAKRCLSMILWNFTAVFRTLLFLLFHSCRCRTKRSFWSRSTSRFFAAYFNEFNMCLCIHSEEPKMSGERIFFARIFVWIRNARRDCALRLMDLFMNCIFRFSMF